MKNLSLRTSVLICFSIFFLSACASKKAAVEQTQAEKFDELQEGRTTMDEVRVIFGMPDASLTKGKSRTWVYREKNDSKEQTYQLPQGFQGQGIILDFDAQGILKQHRQVSAEELKALQQAQTAQETPKPKVVVKTEDPKPATVELKQ
jgi:hypothetical protein